MNVDFLSLIHSTVQFPNTAEDLCTSLLMARVVPEVPELLDPKQHHMAGPKP